MQKYANTRKNTLAVLTNRIQANTEQINEQFNRTLSTLDYITIFMKSRYRNKWMTGYQKWQEDTFEKQIEELGIFDSKEVQWEYRFEKSFTISFLKILATKYHNNLNMLVIIEDILCGWFRTELVNLTVVNLDEQLSNFQGFIGVTIYNSMTMLLELSVIKQPILDINQQLESFNYIHVITFCEFNVKWCQEKQLQQMTWNYLKSQSFEENKQNLNLQIVGSLDKCLFHTAKQSLSQFRLDYVGVQYLPNRFKPELIRDGQEIYEFHRGKNRWIPVRNKMNEEEYLQISQQESQNKYLIQKYADFKSAGKLAELLQSIPNFKVKMTGQEQEIISTPGNILVIGRSGTGKTTCAILRLFAMNMLFKLRVQLLHNNNTEGQIDLDNPDNALTFRTIFVTASPVLAYEVKKYYKSLKEQLEGEINKKRMRLLKQKQENGEDISNLEQSTITMLQQAIDLNANDDKQQEEVIEQIEMEDDNLDAEEEFVKEMGAFEKITDIKEFPAFLTLRKLLLMIDAQLYYPFFKQGKSQNTQNKTFGWHNENSGTLMLNGYSSGIQVEGLEDDKQIQMEEQEQKTNVGTHQQAKEVTYEVFKHEFWPQLKASITTKGFEHITASIVWTEIYSRIKGSRFSFSYQNRYLNISNYSIQNEHLQSYEKNFIYGLFQLYESMKIKLGYYDLMDFVNYMNSEIKQKHRYHKIPIHYLILDEVQDLPPAIFVLLNKLVQEGIFYSGDTAQNISKGIGFKFSELKQLLLNQEISKPKKQQKQTTVLELNINFRSHNNILQIANSLVCILELCFPKSIDRLKKEKSDLEGPKPIALQSSDPEILVSLLSDSNENQRVVEFGSSQVIIVKDQQAKSKIPLILQHAIILTIYEAKGLEFDDVILYNFFTDNYIGDEQWQALSALHVQDSLIDIGEIEKVSTSKYYTKLVHTKYFEDTNDLFELHYTKNQILSQQIKLNPQKYNQNNFSMFGTLASELKLLYVAVTRPKKRLIIFDQQPQNRKYIMGLWQPLALVDVLDVDNLMIWKQQNIIPQYKKTDQKEWKNMGIKMFRNKHYYQAAICFENANEKVFQIKSKAYFITTEAAHQQKLIEEELKTTQGRSKKFQQDLAQMQLKQKSKFQEAADLFKQIGCIREAAQCYFSAEQFEQALELYLQGNYFAEAGEAAYYLKRYQNAAEYFLKCGDTHRALDCLQQVQNWDKIFEVLQEFKNSIEFDLRIAFINKFFPKILDQLAQKIEQNNEPNQDNQIIQELDEEDQEAQDDYNVKVEKVQVEEANIKQQESQEMEILQEEQSMNEQIEFIDEEDESQSFIVQNVSQAKSASFQVEEQENADHLSFYDPDDQWLNSEKFSVVESIMSKASEQSDFSAVMLNQVENNPNIQLIKTKVNIYIQDQVIQELIRYMLMFQEEFKVTLEQQRSKSQQLSGNDQQTGITNNLVEFMLDMDQIDIPFVHKMLDILEQYQSYKLCIFVCNKYKLADKLGRYLVSIAANYTPFQRYLTINPNMITNSHIVKQLSEQAQLASFAVHNVLEYINPEFLRTKYIGEIINEFNDLGQEQFQALIHLGYWKKAVFAMDYMNAIEVFIQFQDWRNALKMIIENEKYQIVNSEQQQEQVSQLNSIIEHIDFPDQYFTALNFETPKTETQFLIVKLSLCQFYQCYILKLISINKQVNKLKPQLGQYYQTCLPLTALLLDFIKSDQQSYENLSKIIHSISDHTNMNGTIYQRKIQEIEIPLVAQCLLQILSSQSQKQLIEQLTNNEFQSFLDILIKLIRSNKAGSNQQFNKHIMYALSITTNHKLFPNHQYYGLVHKTSPLMNNLTKINPNWSQCFFSDINFEFVAFPKQQIEQAIQTIEVTQLKNLIIVRQGNLYTHYQELNIVNQFCITPIEHNFTLIADLVYQIQNQTTLIEIMPKNQRQRYNPKIGLLNQQENQESQQNSTQWLIKTTGKTESQILLIYEFLRNQLQLECRSGITAASSRHQMIKIGIRYLRKAEQSTNLKHQHKNLIKGILIMHYCNQSQLSIITLQKIEKKQIDTYSYLKYIEMLECQHYSIIYDSMQCYFEYHENTKMLMFDDELYGNLSRRVIHQIIGFSLFTKDSFILKLPEELAFTLYPMKLVGESQYQLRIPITPIDNLKDLDDLCYIIMEYIQTSNSIYVSSFTFVLIMVILNVEKLSPAIKDCINKFELYFKNNQKVQGITKVQQLINKTLKQRQEALLIDYELQYIFQQQQFYVDIEVHNTLTLAEQEQQYNQCLQKWSSFDSLIVRLKAAVNTISKYYTQYKSIKNNQNKQTNKQLITRISSQIDQFYKLITCNQFNFQQSVDYHFIQQQFKLQKKYHLELNKLSKLNTDDIKLLEEIIKQTIRMFEEWINQQTVAKHNSNILELNRRQIAQKWLNRKAGIRIKLRK